MAERGAQSLPDTWPPARRVEVARDVLTTARVPELLAEVERLRETLASCGGLISGMRDEYCAGEWRESQAHRLCLDIVTALGGSDE